MTTADWVRLGAFIGNAVLFYASIRNQRWARKQARLESKAGVSRNQTPAIDPEQNQKISPEDVDRLAAEIASRPYFDHTAYWLLCVGFALTAIAALIDLWESGTVSRMVPH